MVVVFFVTRVVWKLSTASLPKVRSLQLGYSTTRLEADGVQDVKMDAVLVKQARPCGITATEQVPIVWRGVDLFTTRLPQRQEMP